MRLFIKEHRKKKKMHPNQKKSPREVSRINHKMMIARKKSKEIQLKSKNET